MGYGHGRVPHDTPECPGQGVYGDDGQSYRHIADVRSAQHLLEARAPCGGIARPNGERPNCGVGLPTPDPLGFLVYERRARTITEAAYRFVRHEPGVDVVLFGTGNLQHLRENIAALLAPPLPPV